MPSPSRGRRHLRRLPAILVTLAVAVMLPLAAIASDTFNDVTDANIFHDAINRLYGSRITTGCSATNNIYCPSSSVTRGQMAAFLNRGLGRVGYRASGVNADVTGGGSPEVNRIDVLVGGLPGGYGMLKIDASGTVAASDVTDCPCQVGFWLWIDGVGSSNTSYTQVDALAGGLLGRDSTALTWAVRVPSGTTVTIYLFAHLQLGAGDTDEVTASGDMTVLYVPFDAFGTNNDPQQTGP